MGGDLTRVAKNFMRFADDEAHGRSPLYEQLAQGVAGDQNTLRFLLKLPHAKRQPNLLFAAVRHLFGTPADWGDFKRRLSENPAAVRDIMLERSTQTNEPARCATLLPVFAQLPEPLALIEVGASAGLCLLPDKYGYDYGNGLITPEGTEPDFPIFSCAMDGAGMRPTGVPRIAWRAGLDLNPLDVSDDSQVAWLETLVWPEETECLANLRKAVRIAANSQPRVIRGDLRNDLLPLCREAPKNATLVVFHTAVLAYVASRVERDAFAAQVANIYAHWISNEPPHAFSSIATKAGESKTPGRFLLSWNRSPVAWTDPHGTSFEWIPE
jgi:hypothetical protein